jgi:hypothetical protein
LKEAVDNTPGYYYESIGSSVFSAQYGPKELKRIRNRIRSEFYNVPQLLRIAAKARRIGLVTGRDIAGIGLKLPLILGQWIESRIEKKRRKRQTARAHRPAGNEPTQIPVAVGDKGGRDRD